MSLRVAHFSDAHIAALNAPKLHQLLNKRWTGALNLALFRARHHQEEIFSALLDAIDLLKVDHTICTGDMVNLALPGEFQRAGELLRSHFSPEELTLVPGNHDLYIEEARGLFERSFGLYLPQDLASRDGVWSYPVIRRLPGLLILGLSTAQPAPIFKATGAVGPAQMERMAELLEAGHEPFQLLCLHHPIAESKRQDLLDAEALSAQLKSLSRPPQLIIHGHDHRFGRYTLPGTEIPILRVSSASASQGRAEFNLYVIEGERLLRVERYIHEPESGRFLLQEEEA